MKPFRARLAAGDLLVSDGAMGTMILSKGFDTLATLESLNLEHPDILEEIAAEYIAAGADIVETNTFGASPMKLAGYGLADEAEAINRAAVKAARCAANRAGGRYVAGSVGPTGKLLEPYGDGKPSALRASFAEQIAVLAAEGVDAVFIETMTDLEEALLALGAAREVAPSIPVAVTLTFDETPRGFFTLMGQPLERAAGELKHSGADLVGTNCGNGIETMIRATAALRAAGTLPILVQSNAGLPEAAERGVVYPETPDFFRRKGEELITSGANIIGGCCGTTPEHIRALCAAGERRLS